MNSAGLWMHTAILWGVLLGSVPSQAQLPELPPAAPPVPASSPVPAEDTTEAPAEDSEAPDAPSEAIPAIDSGFIRTPAACPEDFEILSTLLVRDIPSYANRILQSSVGDIPNAYRP
ncbi:MAG: hypothetical protein AAFY17_07830, partial [Cyanobacteria bacterium J06642_11]